MSKVIKGDFKTQPEESYLIREIIDSGTFNGFPLEEIPREDLVKAISLLRIYIPFLEVTLKAQDVKELDTGPKK